MVDWNLQSGEFWNVDNEDYHADLSHIGSTGVRCFSESPELYCARYIDQTEEPEPKGDDLIFGNALHEMLLEPDQFAEHYAFVPEYYETDGVREPLNRGYTWKEGVVIVEDGVERTTRDKEKHERWREHREFWADWLDGNEEKHHLKLEQEEQLQAMVAQIKSNPEAWDILSHDDTHYEQAFRFEYRGVPMKVKFDFVNLTLGLIGDLKTSRFINLEELGRDIYNRKYHWQAAIYAIGFEVLFGFAPKFKYIVSHKKRMYECEQFTLGPDTLQLGRDEVNETLDDFLACRELGHWRSKTHGEADVILDAPP